MSGFSARSIHLSWLALLGATLVSYWSAAQVPAAFAMLAVMVVAGAKVGIVLVRFMELGRAPAAVRLFFVAWVGLCVAVIVGLHALA